MKAKISSPDSIKVSVSRPRSSTANVTLGGSGGTGFMSRWIKENQTLTIPDYITYLMWQPWIDGKLIIGEGSILIVE